jgi:hypothetical protein
MAWSTLRDQESRGWSSDETSKPSHWQSPPSRSRSAPNNSDEAMWNVVRRCGGPFKWLKADLFMLGEASEPCNMVVLEAYSEFLRVLGHRLLPKAGVEPLSRLDRARPEVQEMSFLLASLATRPSSSTAPSQQTQVEREHLHVHDAKSVDPWSSPDNDPWSRSAPMGNGNKGNYNVRGKGIFVPPPLVVEKVVEVPTVQIIEKVIEKIVEVPVAHTVEVAKASPPSCDAGMTTEPSPLYSVVNAEITDKREFVEKTNGNKSDLLEVVKRTYGIIGVDPGISDIEFKVAGTRIELVVKCRDSRLALGVKGVTIKQATTTIEESIGVKPLAVFVERC